LKQQVKAQGVDVKEGRRMARQAVLGVPADQSSKRRANEPGLVWQGEPSLEPVGATGVEAVVVKRTPGESLRAFEAFCVYQALGRGRTLQHAWSQHRADTSKMSKDAQSVGRPRMHHQETKCPGSWTAWSTRFDWAKRAEVSDLEIADQRNTIAFERILEAFERRSATHFVQQRLLQQRIQRNEATLDKWDAGPAVDVLEKKKEIAGKKVVVSTRRVRRVELSAYVALVRATNSLASQAIPEYSDKEQPEATANAETIPETCEPSMGKKSILSKKKKNVPITDALLVPSVANSAHPSVSHGAKRARNVPPGTKVLVNQRRADTRQLVI
jgi:hypothetical protein